MVFDELVAKVDLEATVVISIHQMAQNLEKVLRSAVSNWLMIYIG